MVPNLGHFTLKRRELLCISAMLRWCVSYFFRVIRKADIRKILKAYCIQSRSRWSCAMRRSYAAARLLGSPVRPAEGINVRFFEFVCYVGVIICDKRFRWSRGSVLAFGTQVCGFKPGRSRRIFRAKKSSARLSSEGK
jgi:hypothetical protein